MRLKRLELLGYKTFADPATFLFDEGITAIVGPNGSGKSNVADAVRWALGEQSFSLLRAKRSEDMIFSGSERRARMGMAEVTMTLDNSSRWLPVEFEEVAITRRSHRSGENEYLLNGNRVRLRDITEMLGKSGLSKRTYTVIGQGLIDTALSLRPQERRNLIEEAAGLTLYQSRREDALKRLDETRQNMLRVHDLIAEIEPRLNRLQKQAERATEHEQVRAELDEALKVWYGYQWRHRQQELERVRKVVSYQLERIESQRANVEAVTAEIARVRDRQVALRDQLAQWHRESSAMHARSETHQRELAVAVERRRGLIQRRDELLSEIDALQEESEERQVHTAEAARELRDLEEVLAERQAAEDRAQRAVSEWRQEVSAFEQQLHQAQERQLALHTRLAERQSRLEELSARRGELQSEIDAHQTARQSLEEKVGALRQDLAALNAQIETLNAAARKLDGQVRDREQAIAACQEQRQDLLAQRNRIEQRYGRLRERYRVLERMHQEGAGLYEGVRNVLRASDGELGGVLGAVGGLLKVPEELDQAIEAALGSQLQNIVVREWADARNAIEYLKRTRGGRATFLPLDTLRSTSPIRVPPVSGVLGVASDLVEFEPRLQIVATFLLGRTLVCQDLATAQQVLGAAKGSYKMVTLEGELARSSGTVTGGTRKRGKSSGLLERERALRELPDQLRSIKAQRDKLDGELERLAAEAESLRERVAALHAQGDQLEKTRTARTGEREALRRQVERAQAEGEWHQSLVADSKRELEALNRKEQALRQSIEDLESNVSTARQQIAELKDHAQDLDGHDLEARLDKVRSELAATREEHARREAKLNGMRNALQDVERQTESRRRRIRELVEHLAQIEGRVSSLRQQERVLGDKIQSYAERITPVEHELEQLEERQATLEAEEEQARKLLQVNESRYNQTQLMATRQEDRMEHLQSQIENDLGLVELELGEALTGQPPLPIQPLVASLPEVDALPSNLEDQIQALRRRLSRLGAINPSAPEEYQESLERHNFLQEQCDDLDNAAAQLREVIGELDEVMQREFKRTFHAVSREFRDYFARLFNGGSARLVLTTPDDLLNTGIDIVARPPGKRQQGLAVLSGGERALTAASLIFAILAVSPTPFCVLDEVDAALDEANVGRFRSVLKELSEQTQFVVITHNRYTIEVSDIVYGISMGTDGASCVISQRMEGDD
jgi:chromosome segregation protein